MNVAWSHRRTLTVGHPGRTDQRYEPKAVRSGLPPRAQQGVLELPLYPNDDVVLIVTHTKATFYFEDFLVVQPNTGQYSVTIEQD